MIVTQPVIQVIGSDGLPLALAEAYFYQTGTTSPTPVYEDAALENEHTIPVVADAQGLFPPIFLDPAVITRVKIIASGGDLNNPLIDADPLNSEESALTAAAIIAALGYTPVSSTGATFTGPVILDYTPTDLDEFEVGFRGSPVREFATSDSIVLADSGKTLVCLAAGDVTLTIDPLSTLGMPIGHYFYVYVGSTGDCTLTRGAGVSLKEAKDEAFTDENKVLSPGSFVKVQQISEDDWLVTPDVQPTQNNLVANDGSIDLGGMIRKWGKHASSVSNDATVTITFGTPFPNAFWGASVILFKSDVTNQEDLWPQIEGTPTVDGFTVYIQGSDSASMGGFYWEAWGN